MVQFSKIVTLLKGNLKTTPKQAHSNIFPFLNWEIIPIVVTDRITTVIIDIMLMYNPNKKNIPNIISINGYNNP